MSILWVYAGKNSPIYPLPRLIREKALRAMSINNNVLEKAENINFLTVYIIVICLKSHYIRLYLKRTYVAIVRCIWNVHMNIYMNHI